MSSHALSELAVPLVEAFTAATLIVAFLRKPFRYAFGAIRAWQLWMLPPLALMATVAWCLGLPMPAVHTPWFAVMSAVAATRIVATDAAPGVTLNALLGMTWMSGMLVIGAFFVGAQVRYRRAMAGACRDGSVRGIAVWRATRNDIGPATFGAWGPSIVVPADFSTRYTDSERAMILAHEAMHARRHDGAWLLAAHAIAAAFWFHPFAWWALRAFRHDQELACDAAVVALPATDRRAYAEAIVNVHDVRLPMLPVGNAWGYQHPLTERIAMLKKGKSGTLGRFAGRASLAMLSVGLAGAASVFAATAPPSTPSPATGADYQLSLVIRLDDKVVGTPTICLRSGEPGGVAGGEKDNEGKPRWAMDFTATPASDATAKVSMKGSVRQANGKYAGLFPSMEVKLGEPGTVDFYQLDGKPKVTVTAVKGCPAALG